MALDLVSIGFDIQAKGIKEANNAVDQLLEKVSKLENKKEVKVKAKIIVDDKAKEKLSTVKAKVSVQDIAVAQKAREKLAALRGQALMTSFKTSDNFKTRLKSFKGSVEIVKVKLSDNVKTQLAALKAGLTVKDIAVKSQNRNQSTTMRGGRVEPAFVTQVKELTKSRDDRSKIFTDAFAERDKGFKALLEAERKIKTVFEKGQKQIDALIEKGEQAEIKRIANLKKEGEGLFDSYIKQLDTREAKEKALQAQQQKGFELYNSIKNKNNGVSSGGVLDTVSKEAMSARDKELQQMRDYYGSKQRLINLSEDDVLTTERLSRAYVANGFTKKQANQLTKAAISGNTEFLLRLEQEFETSNKLNAAKKEANKLAQEANRLAKASSKIVIDPISFETSKKGFVEEGFKATDASKLAKMQLSGADFATLDAYKQKLRETRAALDELNAPTVQAVSRTQGLINTLSNIGKFAVLSTIVYGLIEAFKFLSVALVTTADQFAATQARIGLYIKDAEEVNKITNDLAKISIDTNAPLKETAALFAKITPVMQKMGKTTGETTAVVRAFTSSFRISGATLKETEAATIQFAQAMASGRLQGDEFRTMSEAAPRFLKAIVDGAKIAAPALNITTENVKKLSSEGVLTSKVITESLLVASKQMRAELAEMGFTAEQGFNALSTGFTLLIGNFNEGAGITKALGEFMVNLGYSMTDADKSARAFGESVKAFFTSDIVQTLMSVAGILSLLAINMLAAKVATIATTAAMGAAAVTSKTMGLGLIFGANGLTLLQRGAIAATGSLVGLTVAARALSTFFGGPIGIAANVAVAVGAYFLLKDSTAEANQKLADQALQLNITAESWSKLTQAQKENAAIDFDENFGKFNKNLETAEQDFLNQAEKIKKQFSGAEEGLIFSKEDIAAIENYNKVLADANKGVASLTDVRIAASKIEDLGVTSKEKLGGLLVAYHDTAKEAKVFTEQAKILGKQVTIAGNDAENTALKVGDLNSTMENSSADNLISQLIKVGTVARSTAAQVLNLNDKLREMTTGALEKETLARAELDFRKSGKFNQEESKILAQASIEKTKLFNSVVEEAQAQARLNTPMKDRTALVSVPPIKGTKPSVFKIIDGKRVPISSQITSAESNELLRGVRNPATLALEAMNEAERAAEKAAKSSGKKSKADKTEKDPTESFVEQLAAAARLNALLATGLDIDVARIASAKDYNKAYSDNLDIAKQLVEAQKQTSRLEALKSISNEIADLEQVSKLMGQGLSLDEAKLAVSKKITNEVINRKDAAGKETPMLLASLLADKDRLKVSKQNEQAVAEVGNKTKEQISLLTQGFSPALVALKQQYKGVSDEALRGLLRDQKTLEVRQQIANVQEEIRALLNGDSPEQKTLGVLNRQKQVLEEIKKSKEEAKTKPLGDFDNINFEVLGTFGNPFKEALDGLQSYIAGMVELAQKRKDALEIEGLTESKRSEIEQNYLKQKAKLQDKTITQGLKLTKTFFKESSSGYKVLTNIEKAYTAFKIASELSAFAFKEGLTKKDLVMTLATNAKKAVSNAVVALSSALSISPPASFAAFAATAALLAGLGINAGKAKGSFAPDNKGTGTVFGDNTAESESIKKSIDLLADNSKVELPISAAMLRSLRNIESGIGGLSNLLIRNPAGSNLAASVNTGFSQSSADKQLTMRASILIAGVFAPLINGFVAKLFGTKTTIKGQGIFGGDQALGDILSEGFTLQEYVDVNRKKKFAGFTTKNRNSTIMSQADQELANQFTLIFTGFYDAIRVAATPLGRNLSEVDQKLRDFVVSVGKINLQGLNGEEIQKRLEAVFGAEADKIARSALEGLDDFQKVGEGYFETVIRVASGVEAAIAFTERLGLSSIKYTDIINKQGDVTAEIVRQSFLLVETTKDVKGGVYDLVSAFEGTGEELTDFILQLRGLQDLIIATGKSGDFLSSSMALGAGGLDRLRDGLEAYFDMLTPQEQALELQRRATENFTKLGETLPKSFEEYKALIAKLDLTKDADRKRYGQLIALAPEFQELQDALESATSGVSDLVQSLRSLAEEANKAIVDQNPLLGLDQLRAQFATQAALAASGSTDAAKLLPQLGRDLISVSKQFSVDGGQYAKDLAMIQRGATIAADVQQGGVGIIPATPSALTPNTSLTPISSSGVASNTSNTSATVSTTDQKLQDLTDKVDAYLFAIAKNTQRSKDLLEDWDDGGRMNVRIEQDLVDPPLRVDTV